MKNYNVRYRKFIDDKNAIAPQKMRRNEFYLVKEYKYVDGDKKTFTESEAPIIYTLFVSKAKDIVHCVKVSNVRPDLVKRFFGKFLNKQTEELEMKGRSSAIYESIVKKVPIVTNDAYRTYKLSGLKRVLELTMDVAQITPKITKVKKILPKPKIEPKK